MTVSIHGVLSHKRLMELKNCGVVKPELFEKHVSEFFNLYRLTVSQSLLEMNKGFFTSLFYGEYQAKRDAEWMFPDRRDLLKHLIYLDGKSKYITLSEDELNKFSILHQAAVASEAARKVLTCFKYSDQVLVDDDTGFNIDWLLKNAYVLKKLVATLEGETINEQ